MTAEPTDRVILSSPTTGTIESTSFQGMPYTDGYRVAYAVIACGRTDEDPSKWTDYGVIAYERDGSVRVVHRNGHGDAAAAFSDLIAWEGIERGKAEKAAMHARCAAIPAPDGAVALVCRCRGDGGEQWAAKHGGGCPRCGAAGERLNMLVEVEQHSKGSVWIVANGFCLWAFEALAPIGVKLDDARRDYGSDRALYHGPVSIDAMRERLREIGWLAAARPKAEPKAEPKAKAEKATKPKKTGLKLVKGGAR